MKSSETKGLASLCSGFVFIIVSLGIEPYNYPVVKPNPYVGWSVTPLRGGISFPYGLPLTITTYPLLLPCVILMVIGLLLVVIGLGMMLNLYGKKDYHGD